MLWAGFWKLVYRLLRCLVINTVVECTKALKQRGYGKLRKACEGLVQPILVGSIPDLQLSATGTLNSKPLNPEPLNPKPQNFETLCRTPAASWGRGARLFPGVSAGQVPAGESIYELIRRNGVDFGPAPPPHPYRLIESVSSLIRSGYMWVC